MRTTGAPNAVTPGAEGAACAVPSLTAAAALVFETGATLAIQAANIGADMGYRGKSGNGSTDDPPSGGVCATFSAIETLVK